MIQKILIAPWLFAFLCALFFFNDFELESFGLSALSLFVFSIIALFSKKEWHIPQSLTLLLMALFWLLTFISLLHTDILNTSIMAFVYFSALPLTFFVFVIKNDETLIGNIAKMGAVLFAGLALWALAQYFVFGDYFGGRAHHPLKNPNSLGALFSLIFFASIGWMLIAKAKAQSNLALILSILLIGGIIATASRGALFALIPVMALMLFFMRGQVKQHWKCLSILGISALVLFALSAFGTQPQDTMMARVTDTVSQSVSGNLSDASSNRFMLWRASIDMIQAHGLFGVGIGNYFQYFNEFRLPNDKWGTYYAHSDPLQYWVELGVLGPILFYAFCIAVMVRTFQAVKKTNDAVMRTKILVPFFALIAMIIHTHVTFNLYNLSILYVSGFMLSFWFMATQNILKTPTKTIKFPSSYKTPSRVVAISLPFIIIGFFFGAMMVSEHLTQRAKAHLMAGDLQQFGQTVMRAQSTGLGHNYRADLLAVNLPLSLLSTPQNFNEEQRRKIFNEGLFYLNRASIANPRSASAQYYLGLIQEDVPENFIPDGLNEPKEYYANALKLDPLHFVARIALANRLDKKDAVALLEQGVHYRYNNPQAINYYMKLLSLYAQTGQAGKMKEMSETIRNFQERVDRANKKADQSLF